MVTPLFSDEMCFLTFAFRIIIDKCFYHTVNLSQYLAMCLTNAQVVFQYCCGLWSQLLVVSSSHKPVETLVGVLPAREK